MVVLRRLLPRSELLLRLLGPNSHEDLRHPYTAVHALARLLTAQPHGPHPPLEQQAPSAV